jgi:hypothetical protein
MSLVCHTWWYPCTTVIQPRERALTKHVWCSAWFQTRYDISTTATDQINFSTCPILGAVLNTEQCGRLGYAELLGQRFVSAKLRGETLKRGL